MVNIMDNKILEFLTGFRLRQISGAIYVQPSSVVAFFILVFKFCRFLFLCLYFIGDCHINYIILLFHLCEQCDLVSSILNIVFLKYVRKVLFPSIL